MADSLILGASAAMRDVVDLARRAAETPATVLLLGESGTGKEVLARRVHGWSRRAAGPLVAVNCAALAPELLESELFGHERGAFTGAEERRIGRFEAATGGTLFLDEIAELPLHLQAKLLRVLQEREVTRVGGTGGVPVDVRIIAATNRDLSREVEAGCFREDLFYRLDVVTLVVPPLRDRVGDIGPLTEHLLDRVAGDLGCRRPVLSAAALSALQRYDWPGNVRELRNVLERAAVLSRDGSIGPRELPVDLVDADLVGSSIRPLADAVADFKRRYIQNALDACGGSQTTAAGRLGMHQSNLSRLMKSLGLSSA